MEGGGGGSIPLTSHGHMFYSYFMAACNHGCAAAESRPGGLRMIPKKESLSFSWDHAAASVDSSMPK